MSDKSKIKKQLIVDIEKLRQQISELKESEIKRKKAEETLKKAEEELESKVKVHTAELEELNKELKKELNERQRAEKIQGVLFNISRATSLSENLNELLKAIHQQLASLIDTTNFFVALYDEKTDRYSFPYYVDEYDKLEEFEPLHLGKSLTDYVRRTGGSLLADEKVFNHLEKKGEVELVGTQCRIWLGAPLKSVHGVIGVVVVQSYTDSSVYSEKDLELLSFVSGHIAMAIERKRAEEALRESEEMYKTLIRTSPDAVTVSDLEGHIIEVSQQTVEQHGFKSAEELIGENGFELISPEDREKARRGIQKILKEGASRNAEYILLKKDGTRFVGEVNAALAKDAYDKPKGFIITTRDITERKRCEEVLLKSEERYRHFVESSPNPIFTVDEKKIIKSWNRACEKVFQYGKDIIGQKYLMLLLNKEDRNAIESMLAQVFQGRSLSDVDISYKCKDGTVLFMVSRLYPLFDDERKARECVFANTNITERKQAEEALKESEEKFRSLAEQSPNMIFINKKGRVVYANKRCEDVMGYKREEFYVPDFDFLSFIPPESIELIKSSFRRHMKGEDIEPYEYILITKNGRRIEALITTKLINYEDGKAILGIITDITERKKAVEELKKSEERFRAIFENSQLGIYVTTPDGRIKTVNQALVRINGYDSPEELMAADLEKDIYICPEDMRKLRDELNRKGYINNYEINYRRKDGSIITCLESAVAIRDEKGKIIEYQGTIADISKRKKLEEENINLNKELNKINRQLRAANIKLMELSIKDGLTKIYNRHFFQESLLLNFNRAKRINKTLSCIMFDIDDFKKVNDFYGHRAGDFVLIELVSLIKKNIRESDLFARYGGEEFVILLPDNDMESSVTIAKKIRNLVELHDFIWKDVVLKVTISLGVSSTEDEGIDSKQALMEVADRNLLMAKNKGKNCVQA